MINGPMLSLLSAINFGYSMNLFEGRLHTRPVYRRCKGGCGKVLPEEGAYCISCYTEMIELNRQIRQDSEQYYRDNPTPRNKL